MPRAHRELALCLACVLVSAAGSEAGDDRSVSKPPREKAALLVVAPRRFHGAIAGYVRYKRKLRSTFVVTLEEILRASSGRDDAERLKRGIYALWKEKSIRYVLLVGDADVLPVRYMVLDRKHEKAANYAFYPSDLYYADLAERDGSFEDWNASTDSFHRLYYGEVRGEHNKDGPINFDRIDYRPEVAVGRWPVSSAKQAAIVAGKTVRYEQGVLRNERPGRSAFIAVEGWVDSRGLFDRMADGLEPAWRLEKRYYRDDERDDGTAPPSAREVLEVLNDGVDLVFHAGHGRDGGWDKCLAVRHLGRLTNGDRLPVILSAGCSTAQFAALGPYAPYTDLEGNAHDGTNHGEVFTSPPPPPAPYQRGKHNTTGLGEKLLRGGPHGAVAYVGCNTGSQPCALTLLRGFAEAAGEHPEYRLGDAWNHAVEFYFEHEDLESLTPKKSWYPPSVFFQAMKFMVFGDPSLPLARRQRG